MVSNPVHPYVVSTPCGGIADTPEPEAVSRTGAAASRPDGETGDVPGKHEVERRPEPPASEDAHCADQSSKPCRTFVPHRRQRARVRVPQCDEDAVLPPLATNRVHITGLDHFGRALEHTEGERFAVLGKQHDFTDTIPAHL